MPEPDPGPEEWVQRSANVFLWLEHATYVVLGVLLSAAILVGLAGAGWVLLTGLSDWTGTGAILVIIDRLLFVLMMVEILHTVRASMRSGALNSEPFLVVGLIATIRRVLVITLKSSETTTKPEATEAIQRAFQSSMLELGVLAVLIVVMVVAIRMVRASAPAGA